MDEDRYEDKIENRFCEVCGCLMGKMTEHEWICRDNLCDKCIEDDKDYITWP